MSVTEDDRESTRIAVASNRARSAREELWITSRGEPNTPELSDEQLALHGRTIIDRARAVYEVWKTCKGPVPQPLSHALMSWREVYCLCASDRPLEETNDGP